MKRERYTCTQKYTHQTTVQMYNTYVHASVGCVSTPKMFKYYVCIRRDRLIAQRTELQARAQNTSLLSPEEEKR